MKKFHIISIIAVCLMSVSSTAVKAQKESKTFSAGFGLEAGLPLGDAKNIYNSATGITIRFAYHAGPGFVTLTSGVVAWLPKSGLGNSTKASLQIPVKAGYKYVFSKPFFVMMEAGYSSFKIYYDNDGTVASSTAGGFTYAPTAGVTFNAFEAGIKYEATSANGGTFSNLALRLGLNF